jgi:hypothetical protein
VTNLGKFFCWQILCDLIECRVLPNLPANAAGAKLKTTIRRISVGISVFA